MQLWSVACYLDIFTFHHIAQILMAFSLSIAKKHTKTIIKRRPVYIIFTSDTEKWTSDYRRNQRHRLP